MPYYRIYKHADERGVSHPTALLIWECTNDEDEFLAALDDVAAGYGFAIID